MFKEDLQGDNLIKYGKQIKLTILNGDMNSEKSKFTAYLNNLAHNLKKHHQVDTYTLNELDLKYCSGCWSCWWKTPGQCATKDDAEPIFKSVISSDFILFASPLYAGFTSSALKKITDRLIVLLHPYIELKNGECHHKKRYENYPDFGLLLEKEADTDEEDIEIIKNIYDRLAINFHSNNRFIKFINEDNMEDIIYETVDNQRVAQV